MSRFTDMRRSFLAPYVRLLREWAGAGEVPDLTPSQVAMILGWDQQYAIRAVPLTDAELRDPVPAPEPAERPPSSAGAQRLRRII